MPDRPTIPLWGRIAVPLVVLVVALVVGSGVFEGSHQTLSQHASAIERVVRCPSCIDVSVADSDESTAIAVRHEVVKDLHEGQSSGQIEQTLVSQYGPTILLEPPDSGGFALIWIIPIVLGVGALGTVLLLFIRRSRQFAALRATTAVEEPV
jgi:cytochrome c-type biogenesis protein CcmH/NrfF